MSDRGGVTRPLRPGSGTGALEPGAIVGEWRVTRQLATGGFGSVYEVLHVESGVAGALKLLHPHLVTSSEMVARAMREARVIAALRHPSIVELLAAGVSADGQPYLVMELLVGQDLATVVSERGRLPPPEVIRVVAAVADALGQAHEHAVVHRDIKASNVFLVGSPAVTRIVLLDFGIAKLLDGIGTELTASRQALGTPACMAPEQIQGGVVDGRTDVYGLGALAFHLLTGRMPFEEQSATMAQYLHLHAARPRPSAVAPVAAAIDEVIARAMAIVPAQRHPTPWAFHLALADAFAASQHGDQVCDATGVLLTWHHAGELDDGALDDLERVVPMGERALAPVGFRIAADLGDAALFVSLTADPIAALKAVTAAARELEERPGRDPRITIAWGVHRAAVTVRDGVVVGGRLLDLSTWGLPDTRVGVWLSTALDGPTPSPDP